MTEKHMHSMVLMVINTMAVNYNLPDQARKKLIDESTEIVMMFSNMNTELFERIARRIEHWAYEDADYFEKDPEVLKDYKLLGN